MSIDQQLLDKCLKFIDGYWDTIIHQPEDSEGDIHAIPLPRTFIVTNANQPYHWKGSIFYWDSFFMFRGLIDTPRQWLVPDMVDNFVYLFNKFGIIPNASRWAFLGHSQPPFFSSMTFDAYYIMRREKEKNKMYQHIDLEGWLEQHMSVVKEEYWRVWEDTTNYHHHVADFGLSRYGDRDVGYALTSERESGWDFTTRFYNRCNEFLAIDLNAYLHKYEKDFAKAAHLLGDTNDEEFWDNRAKQRHINMKKYMWNEEKGFFFDYDYVHKQQSEFYSLAGFVPLWAKLATPEEAKRVIEKLPLFETDYGLVITTKDSLPGNYDLDGIPEAYKHSIKEMFKPKQWDWPHIWAPLEYLTVIGLLRYGYVDDAVRIMQKSINANLHIFDKYGALFEKIDATTGEKPATFWYPVQLGFGWTNAIFFRYVNILNQINKTDGRIYPQDILDAGAPYSLTGIIH